MELSENSMSTKERGRDKERLPGKGPLFSSPERQGEGKAGGHLGEERSRQRE